MIVLKNGLLKNGQIEINDMKWNNEEVEKYFNQTNLLNKQLNFSELSMGMSSDYLKAAKHSSSYLRIGSSIFGKRI